MNADSFGEDRVNKHFLKIIAGAVVVLLIVSGVLWWIRDRERNVSTTDAFVTTRPHMVTTRIPGVIVRVQVHENQIVHRGDPILELDPRDVDARLAVERAEIETASRKIPVDESQVKIAIQGLDKSRRDLIRGQSLEKGGFDTKEDLDHLEIGEKVAVHELSMARKNLLLDRAVLKRSEAALDADLLNKEYLTVRSPVSGRITARTASLGLYVSPGQSLATLIPFRTWIIANMKETSITHMKVGDPVTVRIDAYPEKTFRGRVESFQQATGAVMALLPPENATGNYTKVVQRVPVRISLAEGSDPDHLLKPGLSVIPTVHVDPSYNPPFGH